ncbi:hypothetical protein CIB84_003298, partial [Bambusicola thoracicus]
VWDLKGKEKAHFVLRSPGMSVCWHPEEAFKLMVAEKNGTIRFYDLCTHQAILSLECQQTPLMSADWCLKNTLRIGAVAGSDWLIWDIACSSYPRDKRPVHVDRARLFSGISDGFTQSQVRNLQFACASDSLIGISERYIHFIHRWSRVNENLFATIGYPGKATTQLLVHHLGHPQVNF